MNAHAIDIERCTECPLLQAHDKTDRTARCEHPGMLAIEQLLVDPWAKPPKACPLRELPALLRVTS